MKTIVLRTGKTKTIRIEHPEVVEVHLSDYVTAGDGVSRVLVPGKGALSCTITGDCFRLLEDRGIPNSYLRPGPTTNSFLAIYTTMAPIKVVCRGIAIGNYLRRHPEVEEGHVFERPVVEFFSKEDANHKPIILEQGASGTYILYDAGKPSSEQSKLIALPFEGEKWHLWGCPITGRQIKTLFNVSNELVLKVYKVLSEAWKSAGYTLAGIKIEVGTDEEGDLLVSDSITPDEWRLWKDGKEIKCSNIEEYRKIAEITSRF